MQTADSLSSQTNTGENYGSFRYRTYVLLTLTVVYIFNFLDHILISVIGRPIIEEFGLSNFQFGILTGFGFALFYTTLGIPIARFSDRYSRVRIIGFCAILWSIATVLCGYTVGFASLLLARLAVGIGEAGCTAPSNSLISDYYKPSARPSALGIFAGGVMLGSVLAQLMGGYVLQLFSWREAFIYVGAPGVIIGCLVLFTVKEPPRGYSDPPGTPAKQQPSFKEALGEVLAQQTFWRVAIASSFASLAGYSLISFQPLFIQYTYGLNAGETAIKYMAAIGFAGAMGTWLGGFFTQYLLKRTTLAPIIVCVIGTSVCVPLLLTGLSVTNIKLMFILFMTASVFQTFFLGPMFSVTQSVVSLRVRATAVGILLFVLNLIGYGFGPPFIGFLADVFTSSHLVALSAPEILTAKCSFIDPNLSEELRATCQAAKQYGIKYACMIAALFFALASLMFLFSTQHLKKDLVQA